MSAETLLKVGVAMAAVAAVTAVLVALAITLGTGSPGGAAAPAELRTEETAPLKIAETRPRPESRKESGRPRVEHREDPGEDRRANVPPGRSHEPPRVPRPDLPREATPNGPSVSPEDLAAVEGPRRYAPRRNAAFTLTVEALKIYDVPVANTASDAALDRGLIHLPDTQMPWDDGEYKNVYVAGHRLGYPGTDSRLLFYHLDRLRPGDKVVLKGRGEKFKYRVSETLVLDPSDRWAKAPVRGRDMVSLQTCTPIPTFEKRLVVRADRT